MSTRDQRTQQLLAMIGNGLDTAATAYALLVEHWGEMDDEPPDPEPVATENPDTCQHPICIPVPTLLGEHLLCDSCGIDLGPQ